MKTLAKSLDEESGMILITTHPNLRYFFNYAGESFERLACGIISLETRKSALLIPKLDEPKAQSTSAENVYPWTDGEGYSDTLKKAVKDVGGSSQKIWCEDGLAFWQMRALERVSRKPGFHSLTARISTMRAVKDEGEVQAILEAGAILEKGFRAAHEGLLRNGLTEREASFELKKVLSKEGASSIDFCAVQSGAHSAIPHSETTNKRIVRGDAIVVDVSLRNEDGYFADFTRTYVIGKPRDELSRVHKIVQKANNAGVNASKAGATPDRVDSAARNVIKESGMSEFFFHRTGHGIGLEVHEQPWITGGNMTRLKRGMTFTIEPGIYLEGKFGVRIEDNVIIQQDRIIEIPNLSRDLLEL
ncbi:MAG: M24 family metallopeptidase [Nitrososphaerales archaeon]